MKGASRVAYASMLGLLGSTLIAAHLLPSRNPEPLRRPLSSISPEIAGWKMAAAEDVSSRPLIATSFIARTYAKGDRQLGLLVAFHDNQRNAVGVHTPKNCLPGDGWEIWNPGSATVLFHGRPVAINMYQIYRTGYRMSVLYWYQSRDRVIANEYLAKLALVRDGLFDGRTSGSFIRIVLPDDPGSRSEGLRFAEMLMPQVQLCFRP
jgi:EpsI family protein